MLGEDPHNEGLADPDRCGDAATGNPSLDGLDHETVTYGPFLAGGLVEVTEPVRRRHEARQKCLVEVGKRPGFALPRIGERVCHRGPTLANSARFAIYRGRR